MAKVYNILCVTTRDSNDNAKFHQPSWANPAVADGNYVEYGGRSYRLKYVDRGLSGRAVLLGLDDARGGILELYTDTPVEGSGATPQSLQNDAARAMGMGR